MTPLMKSELRGGWLGIPQRFEPLDFLGVAMGSYFVYQGATNRGPDWLTISIGAIMVYIHTRRFLYAPQDREGLVRLLRDLEVKPEELQPLL